MGAPQEARAELLRRVAATGLGDRQVEAAVPLPQAFLAKARKGGNDSARAEKSWELLAAWVTARETPASPPTATSSRRTPSPAPSVAPSSLKIANENARAGLVKAMNAARTNDDLDLVAGLVFQGIAENWIAGSESNRFVLLIDQKRKLFDSRDEAAARKAAGAPQKIEVVYLQDWRPAAG